MTATDRHPEPIGPRKPSAPPKPGGLAKNRVSGDRPVSALARRRRRTNLEVAREMWEREGWGEPRDAEQERLWIAFFLGETCEPDTPWRARYWTRPAKWIEKLVRQ